MTTSIDVSLVRERNERMLREVNANRLEKRLRANREPRFGWWRTIGTYLTQTFALPFAGFGRAGGRGVRPADAKEEAMTRRAEYWMQR